MTRIPDFDVVIPAHNAAATIVEQLDAVKGNDCGELLEVIVVDSCSSDETAEIVREYAAAHWDKVRLVAASEPGANVARNAGIAAGRAEVVLMCDADDVVSSRWASELGSALSRCDAARGRYALDRLNDEETIAMRGPLGSTSGPGTRFPMGGLGGNCGFRRSLWKDLGGLASHHHGSDDIEFFWRARLAGRVVDYAPDAVVHYRLRPGRRSLYRQQRAWAENRALLFKEFGADFIERRSLRSALRQWAWLVTHPHAVWSSDAGRQGTYVRAGATAIGNIRGSLRHRVWYP